MSVGASVANKRKRDKDFLKEFDEIEYTECVAPRRLSNSDKKPIDLVEEEEEEEEECEEDQSGEDDSDEEDEEEEEEDDDTDLSGFIAPDDGECEQEEQPQEEEEDNDFQEESETSSNPEEEEEEEEKQVDEVKECAQSKKVISTQEFEEIDSSLIVHGKRQRKTVQRYIDKHYVERMFRDVPEEEIDAVVNDADPYFEQKLNGNVLSEEEEGEDGEGEEDSNSSGYDTDEYERMDNLEERKRPSRKQTSLSEITLKTIKMGGGSNAMPLSKFFEPLLKKPSPTAPESKSILKLLSGTATSTNKKPSPCSSALGGDTVVDTIPTDNIKPTTLPVRSETSPKKPVESKVVVIPLPDNQPKSCTPAPKSVGGIKSFFLSNSKKM